MIVLSTILCRGIFHAYGAASGEVFFRYGLGWRFRKLTYLFLLIVVVSFKELVDFYTRTPDALGNIKTLYRDGILVGIIFVVLFCLHVFFDKKSIRFLAFSFFFLSIVLFFASRLYTEKYLNGGSHDSYKHILDIIENLLGPILVTPILEKVFFTRQK